MPSPPRPSPSALRARAARLEREGDLTGALTAYESALAAAPHDVDILAALAQIAERLGMMAPAEGLWRQACALAPDSLQAQDGRARALRELGRYDEAIAVLQAAIEANPTEARLWNSVGVTLSQQGQTETALTFYDEALRLDPRLATAAYNRACARFDLGALETAQTDFIMAGKLARKPADAAMITFAAATLALARGDLAAGWEGYEARLSPHRPKPVVFEAPGRRWTPNLPLAGKRLLVLAEQGLGDELLFASLLPDVFDALGPEGRLTLAVEPRLVDLFARSFPQAVVLPHRTEPVSGRVRRSAGDLADPRAIDLWAPLASLPRRFRGAIADFPERPGFLVPDPRRVDHWHRWLGDGPPAVGLTWRSGNLLGDRRRQYPPMASWKPVLQAGETRLVNIQYDVRPDELEALTALGGRPLLEPPGVDLKNDIDDLAALCAALDLVVSVSNATGQLAGACGAPTVMLCVPAAWPRLGQESYPWHPTISPVAPRVFGEWDPAMAQAAELVAALTAHR
ncbi:tetratricopeptide repeat protein [Phenylobacterium sp.]|uniref:tetratricopeptide repeat protein n=1 Tax=Phenylobacterium sp. TaxID=1871053 RepID=UPI0027309062|nr:tetratricopeptide repeat protein [Phenylobacterium sp.]MDP1618696.1 tetratricopeptide repeat protein [Phenylobacterium sp.]MDP1986026.1 tetratricopeptide repeat protein [Phenylobacterium sp.]